MRLAKGSGVSGLGCMYPSTVWAEFPRVSILRPLLEVRKVDLQEVCRNEGMEWIEDPTNQSYDYIRNNIRRILQENEDLTPGITGLVKICQEARRYLKHEGIIIIATSLINSFLF
jgi:tRNA(Ile)-lysidine synthase TilS/MesJ